MMIFTFMMALIVLFVAGAGDPALGEPSPGEEFLVGVYGDDNRTITCVTGAPGATFELVAWVYVPNELGLAYVTLRFAFPANINQSGQPVFNDLVLHVVQTDFPDGTAEWNMLFMDCPTVATVATAWGRLKSAYR